MVTMKEIDEARARLGEMREAWQGIGSRAVSDAEEHVEELLRQWWAQGCRETPVASLLADQRDEARENAARWKVRAENAERERDEINRRAGQWRETSRVQSILDALVSDEPDSKFDDETVTWRKRVRETVERNRVPERNIAERNELRVERNEWQKIAKHNKHALAHAIERAEVAENARMQLHTEIVAALTMLTRPGCMIIEHDRALDALAKAVGVEPSPPRAGSGPRPPLSATGLEMGRDPTYAEVKKRLLPNLTTPEWVEKEIVRQFREELLPRVETKIDEKIAKAIEEHYKTGHPLD